MSHGSVGVLHLERAQLRSSRHGTKMWTAQLHSQNMSELTDWPLGWLLIFLPHVLKIRGTRGTQSELFHIGHIWQIVTHNTKPLRGPQGIRDCPVWSVRPARLNNLHLPLVLTAGIFDMVHLELKMGKLNAWSSASQPSQRYSFRCCPYSSKNFVH
jgi:hypothetical protein